MSDGFDEMTTKLKDDLKDEISWCTDTGVSKVFLKNMVQEKYPDMDKRAIYRTIKEMIRDWDLFYADDGLIKDSQLYCNSAINILERRKQPVPNKIVDAWERKNKRTYKGRIQNDSNN